MTNFDQRNQNVYSQLNVGNVTIHVHAHTPPDVAKFLQRAVRCVQQRRYKEALTFLDGLLQQDDTIADAFYYYALALLDGRRPKQTIRPLANKIETNITAACELDPAQAHYYYLLAWVKYDFYMVGGLIVPEPDIPALLKAAANYPADMPKIMELIEHSGAEGSILNDWINQRL